MRYEIEKAPARVAARTGARKDDFEVNHSSFDSTTSAAKAPQIFSLLQTGAKNGVTLRELVAMTGMNERLVRLKIQQERKAGKLILSNNRDGYFLPERPDDVQRFARSMSRRAAEIASIAHAAESALADMGGQEAITGWDDG